MAEQIDKQIVAVARKQHGYVQRRQLLALGLGPDAIKYRIEIGRLIVVYAGVYAAGHLPVAPEARAHAAVLACGDRAILSHTSAACLWKYTKHWAMPYEVTVPAKRRRPGFAREYALPAPITNTQLLGFEIDAMFPEHRLIVELDGWDFHSDRATFESDRDRDAELLAAGYVTVRIT